MSIPHDGIVVHDPVTGNQHFYKFLNTLDLDKYSMKIVKEHLHHMTVIDECPPVGVHEFLVMPGKVTYVKPRPDKKTPNAIQNILKALHSITVDEYLETIE